ncbi:hypothetical protein Nepgr_023364 [Nepenthes gracilis]|uniref:Major facilitator superfamily (MFS) profile domain-containing protein n=1 Tax=Nepenthes gracilis TaxID=150966 RepID=A0AAD3XXM9_NEPGR|nr:hypothetical protein Nepgr_023364 [Nepenthes gracilis]
MAGGIAILSEGRDHGGKVTWFVIILCMVAAMGGLLFGYDLGVSGGVSSMEPFLKKFFPEVYKNLKEDTKISNYCKFDSQLLTAFTSSLYVAAFIASLIASPMTRSFGRKLSIVIGGAAFLAGTALGAAALNFYMLILGRLLLGVGVGFANQSVPLYLSEMAPARYRGAFNIGFSLCISMGVLSAYSINFGTEKLKGGWGWRVSLATGALPASILTLGTIFLPDTPNSLIQRTNDHQKAMRLLQRVRGTSNVQKELDDIVEASLISKATPNPFDKMTQRKYRPQLVMAIAIPFFQQVTGINVITFYAPLLILTIGFGESVSLLSSVMIGIVAITAVFLSMLVVDRFGRRVLFIFGGIHMFVCQMMIGIIMSAHLKDHGEIGKGYGYLVLVLICIYVAGFCYSWGPLTWLVPSEIFPMEIRSAAQAVTVSVGLVFTTVIAQTFLYLLCHFKAGIFFFFGGWVAVMTSFVYLLLPETRNMPIEKMDQIWKEHWFWSKIVS